MKSENTHLHTHGFACSGLARMGLFGGLLLSAVWLTGCGSDSYFVYRDSYRYHRPYYHEHWDRGWDNDWRCRDGGWDHDHDHYRR